MGEENNLEPHAPSEGAATGPDELEAGAPVSARAPAGALRPNESPANSPLDADSKVTTSGKTGLTPGQRLALKRDKKSQQKQELKADIQRQKDDEQAKEKEEAERSLGIQREPSTPDPVAQTATQVTSYFQHNRGSIVGSVVGVVALGFAIVLSRSYLFTGSSEQANLLATAVESANAQIDENNTEGKDADGKPVFKSAGDRAAKAADAYAAAAKHDADSLAGKWAKLGQSSVMLAAGKVSEAQTLFSAVYGASKDRPVIAAQALEGSAIALEAAGKVDEALKRLDELKAFEGESYKDLAEYHVARIKLARGDRDGAKTMLKGLYDRLNSAAASAPKSRYLKGEVEVRLAELDSSLVPAGSGEGQQFSPEEIQRLIQQMQLQQKGSAPGSSGE